MASISTHTRTLLSRIGLGRMVGMQYNNERDIYKVLGYKEDLTYIDYFSNYARQDVAKAIIDRPVQTTWKGGFNINEIDEGDDSQFVKEINLLRKRLKLDEVFRRVDRLASLGEYAALFLGFSDISEQYATDSPVVHGSELRYIKPVGQNNVTISKYDTDPASERYMLPLIYTVTIDEGDISSKSMSVHYSRVIHIVEDPFESEIFGTPRLESVYNRLEDLQKLVGASAEMFWRGARPGFQSVVGDDYTLDSDTQDDLQDQMDEYENGLRRIIAIQGMELKELKSQISDPKSHVDIQLMMISAATNIPKRMLTGSESAELASSQDVGNWKDYIVSRRVEHAEPHIVRNLIDRLIELKAVPEVEDYDIIWVDLFSVSDKDRAEVGKIRAQALKEYTSNSLSSEVVGVESFFKWFLGLEKEETDKILQEMEEARESEETSEFSEEEEQLEEELQKANNETEENNEIQSKEEEEDEE